MSEKKTQLYHRNAALMRIHGAKYLNKNFTFQVAVPKTRTKLRTAALKNIRIANSLYSQSTPPLSQQSSMPRQTTPACDFFLEGKSSETCVQHFGITELPAVLVSVSAYLECRWDQSSLDVLGQLRTKESDWCFTTVSTALHNWEEAHNLRLPS